MASSRKRCRASLPPRLSSPPREARHPGSRGAIYPQIRVNEVWSSGPTLVPQARSGCALASPERIPAVGRLDQLDLSLTLSKKEEAERLAAAQQHLLALRLALGGKLGAEGDGRIGPPVCVLFEGWDASG